MTAAAALMLAAVVGWVGFVTTSHALRQAQANESLSLDIFERLFDRLGVEANFLPPPPGRSSRRQLPPPGQRTQDVQGLSGRRRPAGPPGGAPPPPAPTERAPGDRPGGPGSGSGLPPPPPWGRPPGEQPGGPGLRENPTLLRDVLAFYDRFARQNATNPRLQLEAAWAYRRVGAIHESLGQRAEAEQAYARAITMLEGLVAQHPGMVDYRAKLVETYIMANPWTAEPAALPAMEHRLRRAEVHAERLAAASPEGIDGIQPMIHVQAKLGTVLRRTRRPDEAEARYRRAIELAGTLLNHLPTNLRARLDRADTREALALLEAERGRDDQARSQLAAAVADLQAVATDEPRPAISDRFNDLAEDYRELGDAAQARELSRWADRSSVSRPGPPSPP